MNNKQMMAELTARVLEKMEQGNIPWRKPWICGMGSWSRATGKPYSFLNNMLLDGGREYATFKQIQADGGKVNKGAKAQYIYFFTFVLVDENGKKCKNEEDAERKIPLLRRYPVFDIEKDTNLKIKHIENIADATAGLTEEDRIKRLEELSKSYLDMSGVKLYEKSGDRAFYRPSTDSVTLPQFNKFASAAEYYSTMFHEFAHSTGHSTRLDRLTGAKFGSGVYSREELVAEMTAAAILNSEGFETEDTFTNSVAYIQSWASVLREDPAALVWASSRAEKAYTFIKEGKIA